MFHDPPNGRNDDVLGKGGRKASSRCIFTIRQPIYCLLLTKITLPLLSKRTIMKNPSSHGYIEDMEFDKLLSGSELPEFDMNA